MAGFYMIMVAPFVIGGIIYESIYGSNKKRDLANGAEVSAMLFQFNQSALRGQDLERLHGIVMTMGPTKDTAVFTGSDFDVNGTMSFDGDLAKDFLHGGLSFQIPGLESLVEGTWVTVNPTSDNETTKAAFDATVKALQDGRERETPSLHDLILSTGGNAAQCSL